jgi:WD40 repeat protein
MARKSKNKDIPPGFTLLRTLKGHVKDVYCCAWSPDGRTLASSSADQTIRLWNAQSGQEIIILEGHTDYTAKVSFSHDNRLLASSSTDSEIRLWNTKTWKTIANLRGGYDVLAFHPHISLLATGGQVVDKSGHSEEICIWRLDFATLLSTSPVITSAHYTNAKVVLVGDSGVGKSGLGLVLTGQPFKPTESTHGRYVWPFDSQEVTLDEGVTLRMG